MSSAYLLFVLENKKCHWGWCGKCVLTYPPQCCNKTIKIKVLKWSKPCIIKIFVWEDADTKEDRGSWPTDPHWPKYHNLFWNSFWVALTKFQQYCYLYSKARQLHIKYKGLLKSSQPKLLWCSVRFWKVDRTKNFHYPVVKESISQIMYLNRVRLFSNQ